MRTGMGFQMGKFKLQPGPGPDEALMGPARASAGPGLGLQGAGPGPAGLTQRPFGCLGDVNLNNTQHSESG